MIQVELKGGVVRQFDENTTPAEIAKSITRTPVPPWSTAR